MSWLTLFFWMINMRNVIYKYPVECDHDVVTSIPVQGKILKIGIDPKTSKMTAWVGHRIDAVATPPLLIRCLGTGIEFDPINDQHIETVIEPSGFIWHFYQTSWRP